MRKLVTIESKFRVLIKTEGQTLRLCARTYKNQPVDSLVVFPKLRSVIELVQIIDPLQHHLLVFACK